MDSKNNSWRIFRGNYLLSGRNSSWDYSSSFLMIPSGVVSSIHPRNPSGVRPRISFGVPSWIPARVLFGIQAGVPSGFSILYTSKSRIFFFWIYFRGIFREFLLEILLCPEILQDSLIAFPHKFRLGILKEYFQKFLEMNCWIPKGASEGFPREVPTRNP